MKVSSKRPETRVRVERLRLRIPEGDARSAKALASAVAQRLAARVEDLAANAGPEARLGAVRVTVKAPAGSSRERLADSIADGVAAPRGGRGGGR